MTMSLGVFAFAKDKDRDRTFRRRARQLGFRQIRPGFAGVILQGAGVRTDNGAYYFNHITRNPAVLFALLIGENDPRRTEIAELQHQIAPDHLAVVLFPGAHQWAPADVFAKA